VEEKGRVKRLQSKKKMTVTKNTREQGMQHGPEKGNLEKSLALGK